MSKLDNAAEKSKFEEQTTAVDFVIPLELAACIDLIQNPANFFKRTSSKYDLQIDILEGNTQDQINVVTNVYESGVLIIMASGTMQRWEGTSTRFEGRATFLVYSLLSPDFIGILAMAAFLALFVIFTEYEKHPYLLLPSCLCTGLVFALMFATAILSAREHSRYQRKLAQLFNEFFLFKAVP